MMPALQEQLLGAKEVSGVYEMFAVVMSNTAGSKSGWLEIWS